MIRNYIKLHYLVLIIILTECSQKHQELMYINSYDLTSKWQSLNNPDAVIEFTDDHSYLVYRNSQLLFALRYQIHPKNDSLLELNFYTDFTDNETPAKATIQIVDSNRIRFFVWKHHNILDVADEYYRTNNLNSFDYIMKKILSEPE